MTTVVGVRFREVGKIYYFAPGELELKAGDNVIVDTVRGTEFGTVMIGNRKVEDEEIVQPLKVVRRKATADDVERVKTNREKEKNAFRICKEKVKERGLEMKLISAEYTFDNAKVLFYFTADGRVDFRELVKDLAAVFRIRIELRQVGVRDETKLMGGLGGCGRPLCCASYLSDFVPVSIRMAKEQNLSLNPQKISGVCGRLMCCLKNEADTYEDINTRIPKDGGKVITPDGREGIAETVNVLRERVRVLFTDEQGNREIEEFPASELKFTPRRKAKPCECRAAGAAEPAEEYDLDTAELVAEADSEQDPDIKALVRAEAEDAAEERDNDEADANLAGGKKRRHRHRRKRPDNGIAQGAEPVSGEKWDKAPDALTQNEGSGAAGQTDTGADAHGPQGERPAAERSSGERPQEERQHRRRHRHHSGHSGNGEGDNAGNEGAGSEGYTEQQVQQSRQPRKTQQSRNSENSHARRGNSRNNEGGSGNGGNSSAVNSGTYSGANSIGADGSGTNGSNEAGSGTGTGSSGTGTEKKHNGAYRRFRKRRPKNTAES